MTSIVISAVTGGATGGVGIATDMIGSSIYDFNKAKADKLGITVDELYDQNKDEVAIPATIGAAAASLRRIGLKGIGKAINKTVDPARFSLVTPENLRNLESLTEQYGEQEHALESLRRQYYPLHPLVVQASSGLKLLGDSIAYIINKLPGESADPATIAARIGGLFSAANPVDTAKLTRDADKEALDTPTGVDEINKIASKTGQSTKQVKDSLIANIDKSYNETVEQASGINEALQLLSQYSPFRAAELIFNQSMKDIAELAARTDSAKLPALDRQLAETFVKFQKEDALKNADPVEAYIEKFTGIASQFNPILETEISLKKQLTDINKDAIRAQEILAIELANVTKGSDEEARLKQQQANLTDLVNASTLGLLKTYEDSIKAIQKAIDKIKNNISGLERQRIASDIRRPKKEREEAQLKDTINKINEDFDNQIDSIKDANPKISEIEYNNIKDTINKERQAQLEQASFDASRARRSLELGQQIDQSTKDDFASSLSNVITGEENPFDNFVISLRDNLVNALTEGFAEGVWDSLVGTLITGFSERMNNTGQMLGEYLGNHLKKVFA